jgi:MFS family permease
LLNGIFFATLVSRLPDIRHALSLSDGELGGLLLAGGIGAVLGTPLAGGLVGRLGRAGVVRVCSVGCALAMLLWAFGATELHSFPVTLVGEFAYGFVVNVWDVAQNVEAAAVERGIGKTLMPRFHAAWSIGSIVGGAIGVPMTAWHVPVLVHACGAIVVVVTGVWWASRVFLPEAEHERVATQHTTRSAWLERRTLLVGVMALSFASVEGIANDWLSLGIIDGYHTAHWVGVGGFWLFTLSMTAGRIFGTNAIDAWGRSATLWGCAVAAATGVMLTVFGGHAVPAVIGIVLWGVGGSLGFPVGMSAASDGDPARAAARVAVVSTISYTAFLLFPPFLGWLGDEWGTLHALLVVAALMVPASLAVVAVRSQPPADAPALRQ